MKLTRKRIGQGRNNQKVTAAFYRDMASGLLYVDSEDNDRTEEIINSMDFERSWRGRILKNAESGKNPFNMFVKGLIVANEAIVCKPVFNNDIDITKFMNKYLTDFGRNLKAPGSDITLKDIIRKMQGGAPEEEIRRELEKIKEMIGNDIRKRKEQLSESIANNRIPFSTVNNKLMPSARKMKWLYKLLDGENGAFNGQMLDEYWNKYNYRKLEAVIIEEIESLQDKNARSISKAVSRAVRDYHRNFRTDYNDTALREPDGTGHNNNDTAGNPDKEGFLLFLKAVEQHFKKYYPVKSKHSSDARDKSLCDEKNYKFYCSHDFVKNEVSRSIINQLVSGLIQQGKLLHYFYDGGTWQQDFLNSYGLSYIQVEEAFKKSLMSSLSWGINRLTTFFIDGITEGLGGRSNDAGLIDDILLENQKIRAFRENFYNSLRDNRSKEGKELQKRFIEKLAACYPVIVKDDGEKSGDDIEKLIGLVEEARNSVAYLRHSSFHFKKVSLPEMLKDLNDDKAYHNTGQKGHKAAKADYSIAEELFRRDIDRLYDAFREQIRSLGIVEYYPTGLISDCFKTCGMEFTLYSPQNSLIPSFKKVYKRGSNLYKAYKEKVQNVSDGQEEKNARTDQKDQEEFKELGWYIEVSNNEPGWLAYKNLLQLIYYHAFLPEVYQNEALITGFINRTKDWNRKEAEKAAAKKNDFNRNKDRAFMAYRYEAVPDYQGEPLEDYFKVLQREQMARAKEVSEGSAENNTYIQFIQDVIVWAFGAYLERLVNYREALQKPSLQEKKVNEALNELLPEKMEESQFFMVCRFNKDKINNSGEHITSAGKTQIGQRKDLLCFYLFLRLLDAREVSGLQHQFIRYRCSLKERRLPDNRRDIEEEIELFEELEELMELVRYTVPSVTELLGRAGSGFDTVIQDHFREFFDNRALENDDIRKLYYQSDEKTPVPRKHMALLMRSAPLRLYKDMFRNYYLITEKECLEFIQLSRNIDSYQGRLNELHKQLEQVKVKSVKINNQKGKTYSFLEDKDAQKVAEYEDNLNTVIRYKHLQRKLTFEALYTIFRVHVDVAARMIGYAQDWERDMFFLLKSLEYNGKIRYGMVESIFSEGSIVRKLQIILSPDEKEILCMLCWHKKLSDKEFYYRIRIRNPIAHLNHFTQTSANPNGSLEAMLNDLRSLLHYDRKRQNTVTKTINDILLKDYNIRIKWKRTLSNKNNGKMEFKIVEPLENEPIVHLKHIRKGDKCRVHNKAHMLRKQEAWLHKGIIENAHDGDILRCIYRLLAFRYPPVRTYGIHKK